MFDVDNDIGAGATTEVVADTSSQNDIAADLRAALNGDTGADTPAQTHTAERDASGRFVAKEDSAVDSTVKEGSDQGSDDKPASDGEQPVSPTAAPASWSDAEKAEFDKLPPEVKKIVLDRESEREQGVQRKFQEIGEKAKFTDEVLSVLGTRVNELAAKGVSPQAYVGQLVSLSDFANNNPIGFIRDMASHYKLDLFQVAASLVNDPSNPMYNDPEVVQMRTRLQMQDEQWKANQQSRTHNAEQAELQRRHQVVTNWAQEKDASGNLARPHFQAVANEMIPLIAAVHKQNPVMDEQSVLKTAYEQAIYANPTTRSLVLEAERKNAEQEQLKKQREKATQAKSVATSVSGGAPSSRSNQPSSSGSIEDDIRAAIRSLG